MMGGQDVNALGAAFDPEKVEPMETPALSEEETRAAFALHAAPTMAESYSAERLVADGNRRRQSVERLPAWPNDGRAPHGHGWGVELDRALGGFFPGSVYLLGASEAKAGKTSFLMQLADGLALLSAERAKGEGDGPLLPTLILSEMSAAALTWRTLGRWLGVPSGTFRGRPDSTDAAKQEDWTRSMERAKAALTAGPLAEARRFQRMRDTLDTGPGAIMAAVAALDAWKESLLAEHGREVWPVLVVDPIQRLQDGTKGEVEALNELAATVRKAAADRGLVVLMTSDTNKESAKGDANGEARSPTQRAAAVLRGSYQLVHVIDAGLYLSRDDKAGEDAEDWRATVPVSVTVAPNRWGPTRSASFAWCKATGRFIATARTTADKTREVPRADAAPEKRRNGGRRGRVDPDAGLGGAAELVEFDGKGEPE